MQRVAVSRFEYKLDLYPIRWAIGESHKNIGVDGEKLRGRKDLQAGDLRAQNAALQDVLNGIKNQR